ncbi:DUF3872 domain-containing protein [Bacteroides caccae]|jgi:hypothetical protein|uniref:DUF3872 domain-containing protein n=1 Tax=Bacteroides thetaiotaomicron TaxID=818 RepID=A0A414HRB1_BACT4|nr:MULTISPECIES: DUF3872 domain-containing protein [Bacteroidaceae]PWM82532.1 MAG: conjugal transfer protein [Clostridium sp.]DAQ40241.1 MAG TPA: conjugative transposon lipoprotein family protein [Caudoviricetes sp.]MCR2007051.1 DUF3872 domain-containing protein [Bacteroides acidifaciens]MCS2367226.1 DUF3872 domain-containing protein [Bacteroides caccae]MCS3191686.1 DUF3872 domain-containing protein [Bacteroides caccae]
MKKMFETIFVLGLMLVGVLCVVACSDKLDVQQVYEFDMATLPVQKKIVMGEEAEIRCELVREGTFEETKYYIRYFQPDGKGQLRMEDGTVLLPNDLYPLKKETFRLYYKSLSTDQQTIDIYVVDSHGQSIQKTFNFNNESQNKEDEE